MVLLIMTPALVEALDRLQNHLSHAKFPEGDGVNSQTKDLEPSLLKPQEGNPISHSQIIDVHWQLKKQRLAPYHLDYLLKGTKVYIPPPPPKHEPTPEYKALMARLRAAEESRTYNRLLSSPTASPLFPQPTAAHAFTGTQAYDPPTSEELSVLFKDVNRHIMLIFNILLSIVACAAAVWMVGKWWSTPARLALSMGSGLLVGVAEIVVYSGYLRRLEEAKGKERKVQEVRETIKSWVIGEAKDENEHPVVISATRKEERGDIRERRPKKLKNTSYK